MRALLTSLAACLALVAPAFGQQPARAAFETTTAATARNGIDDLVFARLKRLGIQPARTCSDAVFVRRAFLDTIGTLPTAEEARAFIENRSPDKRNALVDRLLERDEFADYWAMKWGEVLRVKSEFPINLWPNAVQAYHRWVRDNIGANLPYDRFARELLTASGSNFRVPPVNFYRAAQSHDPKAIAAEVALVFMGSRFDSWPADRQAAMAAFFSKVGYKSTAEWKEEIVYFDPDRGASPATLPDGTPVRLSPSDDPREVFTAWLVSPKNPWFARAAVNRIWFWLLGRGIVHEADDIRPDNPPVNPELLAYLEREFRASQFDLRHVYRLILSSATYQLSSIPASSDAGAEANFAYAAIRPLDAEVLADAICKVTGTSEQYSSAIPEPYTYIPPEQHSIALADGSITSAFLETFGRPPRDTGRLSEGNSPPSSAQRLYLLNSSDIQRKLQQGPALQALIQAEGDLREMVTSLYLTILSRFPTDDEARTAAAYAGSTGRNRRQAGQDIAWALVNSAEFRFRH